MKKTILLLAAAAMLASCDDDFSRPPLVLPTTVDVTPTTTLAQFKSDYWSTVGAPVTVGYDTQGDSIIFTGRVCSSDESGNIYKYVVIQGKDDNDEQVAMTFAVSNTEIYSTFPYGQEVAVYATGLSVGGYCNLMQFGSISGTEMTFMDEDLFDAHVVRTGTGLPEPTKVDTTVTTVAEINAAKSSQTDLCKWQSRLVRVEGVTFEDAGQMFAGDATTNRYVKSSDGERLNVRCSSYADFSADIIPSGEGAIVGILSYYSSDWQLLLIDEDSLIGFTPYEGDDTGSEATPSGTGTAEDPYNVAMALQVIEAGPAETEVYVKGKIKAVKEISTDYGNASYSLCDDGVNNELGVYRGYWLGGAKFTSTDQLEVGADVIVKGVLVNYSDNTPQFTTGSQIVSYNGQTADSGGDSGTTVEPTGDGTVDSPYNVAKALEVIAAGPSTEDVYVKGIISTISEISTSYGNATYYISDDGTTTSQFQIFRGYWLNGDKFTSEDQLAVGATVIVKGVLTSYNGTPEMSQGSSIYSYDGTSAGGDTQTEGVIYSALTETETELSDGWTLENVDLPSGASYIWSWKIYNEKGYLNGSAYVNGNLASESYAISPVIDLTGATGCAATFEHAAKFQTTLRTLCGMVIREEGTTTWTALTIPTWPDAGSWTFAESGSVDLSAYDGKKVQIAFKYASTTSGADTWEIKNLSITGKK